MWMVKRWIVVRYLLDIEMFYLNSILNFGIPPVLVIELKVYFKVDRLQTKIKHLYEYCPIIIFQLFRKFQTWTLPSSPEPEDWHDLHPPKLLPPKLLLPLKDDENGSQRTNGSPVYPLGQAQIALFPFLTLHKIMLSRFLNSCHQKY